MAEGRSGGTFGGIFEENSEILFFIILFLLLFFNRRTFGHGFDPK